MYVHSFSYLLNKLELGGYTYLQLREKIINCVSINKLNYYLTLEMRLFSFQSINDDR